jgi:cell division protein ZapA
MADVEISINNRSYRISCKDGEEDRIKGLATLLNKQIIQLAEKIGQLGEARMILLASLILLDKSDETEKEAEKILNIATEKIEKLAKDFTE